MNEIREMIKAISVEKIESHIRNLEGIRHPVFAPEALEKAADYIWDCLESYGLAVSAHYFTEDNRAVIGSENSAEMVKRYIGVIERYQIPLPYLPLVVPGNGEMLPDTRRSDHAPFWDMGCPAIMLTNTADARTPHYHQPSDTLDTLNLPFATDVCRAGGGLVCEMAGLECS